MLIRVVHLNKSMNPIRNKKYDIVSLDSFKDAMQHELIAFWNFRYHDSDVSMRVLSGDDRQLDLFSENNSLIF